MMQHSTSTGDDIRQNGEGCARTNRKRPFASPGSPFWDSTTLDESKRRALPVPVGARQSPNAAVRWAPSHSRSCSRRAALTQGAKSASRMPSLLVSTAGECDEVPERVHRERCSGVEDDVTIGSGTTARCRGGRHEPKLGQGAKSHARSRRLAARAQRRTRNLRRLGNTMGHVRKDIRAMLATYNKFLLTLGLPDSLSPWASTITGNAAALRPGPAGPQPGALSLSDR